MRYAEAFKLLLRDPETRAHNLLMGSVFLMIPVIGPLVLAGWHCEIAQRLHRGDAQPVPRLAFEDLGSWLQRGIAPFVANLVVTLPITLVAAVVPAVAMPIAMLSNDPAVVIVILLVTMALVLPLAVLSGLFAMALMTRAELTGDLGRTLELRPALAYVKRNFGTLLGTLFIYGLLAWLVAMAGMLLCFVGLFPASVIAQTALVSLRVQIYEKHLASGGEAIPPSN